MEGILAKALGQDVSKLAAQEKQLLLSRLLARLAHEIRNPLSSMDIHVQLLEEDLTKADPALWEKTAGRLEVIRGELHRLENIVQHFLSLAGPAALDLQPVAAAAVIDYVCELLGPTASGRGIALSKNASEALPRFQADPVQLTQALVNLVINAIQAIEGAGRVEVRARLEAGEETMVIEVADTGPGIPAERRASIFDPFYTTKTEGSGLGLWIVQQIVTAHGGAVSAGAAPKGGALFTLRLPLRPKDRAHG